MKQRLMSIIMALAIIGYGYGGTSAADTSGAREHTAMVSGSVDQSQDMAILKEQMKQLMTMVTQLQKENQETRAYAQSLEKKLTVTVPTTEVPAFAQAGCPEPICRPYLNKIGNMSMGMQASAVGAHVASNEGQEGEIGAGLLDLYLEMPIASSAVFHVNLEGSGGAWDTYRSSLDSFNNNAGSFQTTDDGGTKRDFVQVAEAKVQATFFNDKLTTYIGKIDPTSYFDGNACANDAYTQFLADAFVNNPTFLAIMRDSYVPGVGMMYDLSSILPGISVGTGLLSRDDNGSHLFDSLCWISEVDYATTIWGREGNYRLYGYVVGTEGSSNTNFTDGRHAMDGDPGLGMGISADQKLTERIGIFGRFGRNDQTLAAGDFIYEDDTDAGTRAAYLLQSMSVGVTIDDPWAIVGLDRPDDAAGFAYGTHYQYDNPNNSDKVGADDEHLMELYYRFQVNRQISVSPFFQYAWDVGGDRDGDSLSITGLRSNVEF